jgi:undecaprenyl diphosphate synthase
MDGNGRWAENRGLERVEGHQAGVAVVRAVIQHCLHKKIKVLSLFAFSSENWARPVSEVDFLMQLFLKALKREIKELHKEQVKVCFTGDRSQLSVALCSEMSEAEALTASNDKLVLNFALNYGGKWDIVQAAKSLARQVSEGKLSLDSIDESMFATYLNTKDLPEPDLFIRTSGEQRISNFFLWQLAYTELYFTDVYWPDFTAEEFDKILTSFSARKRRYGQTEKQLKEKHYV